LSFGNKFSLGASQRTVATGAVDPHTPAKSIHEDARRGVTNCRASDKVLPTNPDMVVATKNVWLCTGT
jgi:hypothetical protein